MVEKLAIVFLCSDRNYNLIFGPCLFYPNFVSPYNPCDNGTHVVDCLPSRLLCTPARVSTPDKPPYYAGHLNNSHKTLVVRLVTAIWVLSYLAEIKFDYLNCYYFLLDFPNIYVCSDFLDFCTTYSDFLYPCTTYFSFYPLYLPAGYFPTSSFVVHFSFPTF